MSDSLRDLLAAGDAFQGYAYAYPHKTAYRRLDPPVPLREVWAAEDTSALFLYAHVPFCEVRCGFCNLFTTTNPRANLVTRYLDALERQAEAVSAALGARARFARLAIGGGTPTFLTVAELDRLFSIAGAHFAGVNGAIPKAVESSPGTVDEEKIAFLSGHGVTRMSLGVQSFVEAETRALGRPQQVSEVRRALGILRGAGFACVNIDLIYGTPGQTASSWRRSLEEALEFAPEELYLYPLYVRPLTGLDRIGRAPSDHRLALYRMGRDFLLSRGYEQISMRLFRACSYAPPEGPVYCCQEDGMLGLGAGARSYTSELHYSTEFAVGRAGVQAIIDDFAGRAREQLSVADYGCRLNAGEQRRRYALKSLLRADGLEVGDYRAHFGSDVFADLPQLEELVKENLGGEADRHFRLNARGLELSDVIGPWLGSAEVRMRMNQFALT